MRPLEKKTRQTMFWLSLVAFVLGTPLLIGYSKGYRLNDAYSLVHTGGLYLHSDIPSTQVYVNGVFVEKNGTFLRNTLIQNLTPSRDYDILVTKDGFQSWIKKLRVTPDLVTEARVLMLPKEFVWETIPKTIPSSTEHILATSSATTTLVKNPAYTAMATYFASEKDQFAVEIASSTFITVKGKRVATTTTNIVYKFPSWLEAFASSTDLEHKTMVREKDAVVLWLENGNLYAQWVRTDETPPYYFCSISCDKEKNVCAPTCRERVVIDWQEPITRYDLYPGRSDVVTLVTSKGVFAVELDDRSQPNIQYIVEGAKVDGTPFDFRFKSDGTFVLYDGEEYKTTKW